MHLNNIAYNISSETGESWIWNTSVYLAGYRVRVEWIFGVPTIIVDRVWKTHLID